MPKDTSKLVRVQRTVTRDGTTFQQFYWLKPSEVEDTDIVVANQDVLDKFKKRQSVKSGLAGLKAKKKPVVVTKKDDDAPAPKKDDEDKKPEPDNKDDGDKPAPKPEPDKDTAKADDTGDKPKKKAAPKKKKDPKKEKAKKEFNDLIKQIAEIDPRTKDIVEENPEPEPEKEAPKEEPKAEEKQETYAKDQLDPSMAKDERQKAFLEHINRITDEKHLKDIAYSGIVPEDDTAAEFMSERLVAAQRNYEAHKMENRTRVRHARDKMIEGMFEDSTPYHYVDSHKDMIAGGFHDSFTSVFDNPISQIAHIKKTPYSDDTLSVLTDFTRMFSTYPHSMTTTYEGIPRKSKFPAVFDQQHDGFCKLLAHIADRDPSLSAECQRMTEEYSKMVQKWGLATIKKLSDEETKKCVPDVIKTKAKQNEFADDFLSIFGLVCVSSESKEHTGYFSGAPKGTKDPDNWYPMFVDKETLSDTKPASEERRRVLGNILFAHNCVQPILERAKEKNKLICSYKHYMEINGKTHSNVCNFERGFNYLLPEDGASLQDETRAKIDEQLDMIPVFKADFVKGVDEYVKDDYVQILDDDHYSRSCLSYTALDDSYDLTQKSGVSPEKEMAKEFINYSIQFDAHYSRDAYDSAGDFLTAYEQDKKYREENKPSLLDLKKSAFEKANCSIATASEEEKQKTYAKLEKDIQDNFIDEFEHRHMIKRNVYHVKNSQLEAAFNEYANATDETPHESYHGTSFGSASAILGSGAFHIPKSHEDGVVNGAMLGFGVYEAYTPYKSLSYAGNDSYDYNEYDGDDGYQKGFKSDGVLFSMKSFYGNSYTCTEPNDGRRHNKNDGGEYDSVFMDRGDVLLAKEACICESRMVFPHTIIDVGGRHKPAPPKSK